MDIRPLTDSFAVSPQIDAADIPAIAEAGYRAILCNRPDHEEIGQPEFDTIATAAKEAGLEFRCVPIVSGMLTPDALADFHTALTELPGPVLAYCRTGTRCSMLWAVESHGTLADDDIIERAAKAGYNVAPLLAQLQAR